MMNRCGFTLMELMIAAGVLVFALLGLLAVFIGCSGLNETARNLTIAINGVQREIEGIRNLPFNQIDELDGSSFEITGIADSESEGIIEVDDSNPELLVVTVTVCWRQQGRVIGEDKNLNGIFEPSTEDANANGRLDSPAQIVTLITRR